LWESPDPADIERPRDLANAWEQDIASRGLFPREAWLAAFHLLAVGGSLSLHVQPSPSIQ